MKIKRFNELNESNIDDADIVGITTPSGQRRLPKSKNRRSQYFYDYYTGSRISGKSKYELSREVFKMAQRDDEIGILAQFILQVERDSIVNDYVLQSELPN